MMMTQNSQHNGTVWLKLTKWVSGNDYDSDASNVDDDAWNAQEMLIRLENVSHIQHIGQRWYVHLYTSVPTQPALGRLGPNSVRYVRDMEVNSTPTTHHQQAPVKRRHPDVVKPEHVNDVIDNMLADPGYNHLEGVVSPEEPVVKTPSKKKQKTKTTKV